MVGIDIGRYLEDEACELGFCGLHHALYGLRRTWRRCYLHKAIEQLLHAKVVEGRAEEYGGNRGRTIIIDLEIRIHPFNKLQVITQLLRFTFADMLIQIGRMDVDSHFLRHTLFVGSEEIQLLLIDVVDSLESHSLTDGP